jgi:hypothetical protein
MRLFRRWESCGCFPAEQLIKISHLNFSIGNELRKQEKMKPIKKVLLLLLLMVAISSCSQQPYNNHHSTMGYNQDNEVMDGAGRGGGGMH